jgi:uncharacterized protein
MPETRIHESDVVIAGGGLAGLATAIELLDLGRRVLLIDRAGEDRLGGLARESFGGICMAGTPEQRKMGIKDSPDLALSDWKSFAEFSKEDRWPLEWANYYTRNSVELVYHWLRERKVSFLPMVAWPERGLFVPGNSVPRWHITWGTGQGLILAILAHLERHPRRNNLKMLFRHNVQGIEPEAGRYTTCYGVDEAGGMPFRASGSALVIASGGICGGDLELVKKHWSSDFGDLPPVILNGSHEYADGALHLAVEQAGGNLTHLDKQWHYAAGIHHPRPARHMHGLSLIPPKSALWVNGRGERIGPVPLITAYDTRYLVERISKQPGGYSWQVLNYKIAKKELAVSGSEYMTDFRDKKKFSMIKNLLLGNEALVKRLQDECRDFLTAANLPDLVRKMNRLNGDEAVDLNTLKNGLQAYDDQIARGSSFMNDDQLRRIAHLRQYRGDRMRTCKFQKILDPDAGPLIAIREFILSRKSLGGIQTDLKCRVLNRNGGIMPGLYAAGEAAGFGGGGIHGKRSLEGTFLGSCILTGRTAGKSIFYG